MPDPLDTLPYETYIECILFATDGREAGPLELLAVSRRWEQVLLDTPYLWTKIYVQNGEDEMAYISVFLHLSRVAHLEVEITTAFPNMDSLRLIAREMSRIATISISPGVLDAITSLSQWKRAAASILAALSSMSRPVLLPSDVENTLCVGISLRENIRINYRVILVMVVETTREKPRVVGANLSTERQYFWMWRDHIAKTIRLSTDHGLCFKAIDMLSEKLTGNKDTCLICLEKYTPDAELRLLGCTHAFHRTCVDRWLKEGENGCPVCRA